MAKPTTPERKDYWSKPITDVFAEIETSEQGLSDAEAKNRLKKYGINEFARQKFSDLSILARQLGNPVFAILIVSASITILLGEWKQSIAIIAMIILSVVLGFFNEYRAERTVEKLKHRVALKALVKRDGKFIDIESRELVLGDIVSVIIGDIIPADMRARWLVPILV